MADFNIIPDPWNLTLHTTIQAGVFFSSVYVVNRFYVQPYLKLRTKRLLATSDSQKSAQAILDDNLRRQQELDVKIAAVLAESRKEAKIRVSLAQTQKEKLISDCEKNAEQLIGAAKDRIQKRFAEEQEKITSAVKQLARGVMDKIFA